MSCSDDSAKSFLARLRGLFGRRSRALAMGAFLLGGALTGMPIGPEEIEELMSSASEAKIVQILEHAQQPAGDPPEGDGIGAAARCRSQASPPSQCGTG